MWQQSRQYRIAFVIEMEILSMGDYLGDNIKKLREQQGLSQAELAEAAGVDSRTIQRIERGKSKPQPTNLRNIAKALGAPVHELQEPPQSRAASPTVPARNKGKVIRTVVAISVPLAALLAVGIYAFVINPWISHAMKPVIITGTVLCADNEPLVAIWVDVLNGGTVNKNISGNADLRPLNSNTPKKTFAFDLKGDGYNLHVGCGGSTQQWKGVYKTETGTGPVYDHKAHYFICQDVSPGIGYGPCDLQQ